MLTEQLFEYWNVDQDTLVGTVRDIVGDADLLLGGSLADDLGNEGSDIDVYCFMMKDAPWSGPRLAECGNATLELHVVDIRAATHTAGSLLPLVTDDNPPPSQEWPLLSGGTLRLLHALYRDRRLNAETGSAEWLRRHTGADLLHIHLALRATTTAAALAEDVDLLTAPEQRWSALYCARLAVESALDAALASAGLINPNPKWRVPLALQAKLVDDAFPDEPELLHGLFPTASQVEEETHACLAIADRCLRIVAKDAFLMRFSSAATAITEFHSKT
ncbi:MAG TPA: nucleotidyltransferase domain-containing protein [Streptosporangiaceae bacterium]|nr:nucleotidyltransferase domain-containing protein [Streptosporangiaceae bacterium]